MTNTATGGTAIWIFAALAGESGRHSNSNAMAYVALFVLAIVSCIAVAIVSVVAAGAGGAVTRATVSKRRILCRCARRGPLWVEPC